MAAEKSERLVNLTILLLGARRPISRARIRASVEGYRGLSDEAFERMFERDKDDLRGLGVPISVGEDPVDEEPGYRIQRDDFELPAIEFSATERFVLGLAATVWGQAGAAADTAAAITKLRAAGVDVSPAASQVLAPRVQASEPAFEPLWTAVMERRRVRFQYRDGQLRHLAPWRLAMRSNAWYVVGFDEDKQGSRVFKLSRITSPVRMVGGPDAFEVPDDLGEELIGPFRRDLPVTLAVRSGRAPLLRRRGRPVEAVTPDGFDAVEILVDLDRDLPEIASFGTDVVVLAPDAARQRMIDHLRGVVGD